MLKMLLALWLCACAVAAAAEKSNFTFSAPYGPHAVGFRVVQQYDFSRSFPRVDAEGIPGEGARPIQTLIWYPAQAAAGAEPMFYGRYLELMATEDDFSLDAAQRTARLKQLLAASYITKNYERERVQRTHAFPDAKPEPGPYPVVIYAPSVNGSAIENADLCEYLASQGYIVLASRSTGREPRGMTFDLKGIEAQVGDIEFLIGYSHNLPPADRKHIAVMGWSWGGMSNIFAAAQDSRIGALVSLDGSSRYQPGRMKEGVTTGLVVPDKLTVPLIYFSSKPYTQEELHQLPGTDMSYDFLGLLKHNDGWFVQTSEMIHPGFSSRFIRFREDQYFTDLTPAEFSRDYSWVAQYTLRFLDAYLRNDAAALQFLKNDPEKNGLPRHLFVVNFREALHPTANLTDFARELAAQGFDQATQVYESAKRKDPSFKLAESDVNRWGYELLAAGKTARAVGVFWLNVAMYPESWNVYDSLGEAQEAVADKQSAIASYRKSLELNAQNFHAQARLKELEPVGSTSTK